MRKRFAQPFENDWRKDVALPWYKVQKHNVRHEARTVGTLHRLLCFEPEAALLPAVIMVKGETVEGALLIEAWEWKPAECEWVALEWRAARARLAAARKGVLA